MKKQFLLSLLAVAALTAVLVSHCSKGSSYSSSNTSSSNNTGTANTITMQNMSFSPTSLTVPSGTTVTWTNTDNITHTATADDNSFNSGDIAPGRSYSKKFDTKGTYHYHCIYHSMMTATIVVN